MDAFIRLNTISTAQFAAFIVNIHHMDISPCWLEYVKICSVIYCSVYFVKVVTFHICVRLLRFLDWALEAVPFAIYKRQAQNNKPRSKMELLPGATCLGEANTSLNNCGFECRTHRTAQQVQLQGTDSIIVIYLKESFSLTVVHPITQRCYCFRSVRG